MVPAVTPVFSLGQICQFLIRKSLKTYSLPFRFSTAEYFLNNVKLFRAAICSKNYINSFVHFTVFFAAGIIPQHLVCSIYTSHQCVTVDNYFLFNFLSFRISSILSPQFCCEEGFEISFRSCLSRGIGSRTWHLHPTP